MTKFVVSVVYKEYRYMPLDADDAGQAEAMAWENIENGFIGNVKCANSDVEIDIYVDEDDK